MVVQARPNPLNISYGGSLLRKEESRDPRDHYATRPIPQNTPISQYSYGRTQAPAPLQTIEARRTAEWRGSPTSIDSPKVEIRQSQTSLKSLHEPVKTFSVEKIDNKGSDIAPTWIEYRSTQPSQRIESQAARLVGGSVDRVQMVNVYNTSTMAPAINQGPSGRDRSQGVSPNILNPSRQYLESPGDNRNREYTVLQHTPIATRPLEINSNVSRGSSVSSMRTVIVSRPREQLIGTSVDRNSVNSLQAYYSSHQNQPTQSIAGPRDEYNDLLDSLKNMIYGHRDADAIQLLKDFVGKKVNESSQQPLPLKIQTNPITITSNVGFPRSPRVGTLDSGQPAYNSLSSTITYQALQQKDQPAYTQTMRQSSPRNYIESSKREIIQPGNHLSVGQAKVNAPSIVFVHQRRNALIESCESIMKTPEAERKVSEPSVKEKCMEKEVLEQPYRQVQQTPQSIFESGKGAQYDLQLESYPAENLEPVAGLRETLPSDDFVHEILDRPTEPKPFMIENSPENEDRGSEATAPVFSCIPPVTFYNFQEAVTTSAEKKDLESVEDKEISNQATREVVQHWTEQFDTVQSRDEGARSETELTNSKERTHYFTSTTVPEEAVDPRLEIYERKIFELAEDNERYKQSYTLAKLYEKVNSDLLARMRLLEDRLEENMLA